MDYYKPPFSPYDPQDKNGFSYETVIRRWPIIITSIIDHLYNVCHELSLAAQDTKARDEEAEVELMEGRGIIEKLSKLKYHMGRDHPLEKIPEDGGSLIEIYNKELTALAEENKNTWFTAPWLYAEYRLIRAYFAMTTTWRDHDAFGNQKLQSFKQSGNSIFKIASLVYDLATTTTTSDMSPARREVVFHEMLQMSLWGNATDLSLLTHLSEADIQRLQSVGVSAQAARRKFILRDDSAAVWNQLLTLKHARIDIVLDNSGFELFTDLVFADFLVTYTPYVSKVVFHPKLIPWFVSDVTPPDFKDIIPLLLDPATFPNPHTDLDNNSRSSHLNELASRWQKYVQTGVFSLSVPQETTLGSDSPVGNFWTTPYPYWDMKLRAPDVFAHLKESSLVIFKGDLNYRKLTGDVKWPAFTPFEDALGPLSGCFPLLSLRTNKADVVVGVDKGVAERLDSSGEKWRVDGRYGLITFSNAKK